MTQVQLSLSHFVVVNGFLKVEHKNADSLSEAFDKDEGKLNYEEIVLSDDGLIAALRFSTPTKADEFAKKNQKRQFNGRTLNILDITTLISEIVELFQGTKSASSYFAGKSSGDQNNNLLTWVYKNLQTLCEYYVPENISEVETKLQGLYN